MSEPALQAEAVTPEDVRAVRHGVLRRGQPFDTTLFVGDDHPLVLHAAVRVDGAIVAVGTVLPDAPPWDSGHPHAWRVRGMATLERHRGAGYGRTVLDALIAHATGQGGTLVWCHARVGALDFYRAAGFVTIGERFDDGVALHQSMWRRLTD